ncbi:MAG: hypothetical protein Kow0099_00030 [Candidatus Abyssubacteria bacterium]
MDEIKTLLDQVVDLGTVYFDISGGDPLLLERKFLLEIIRHASQKGLSTCISTNGQKLDEDYTKQLRDAGLQKLKLSLHGSTAETHDSFTGVPGSFERVLNGIALSGHARIEVWVNAVVTPLNLAEFRRLPTLLASHEVDLLQLSSIVPTGRGTRARKFIFAEDGLERAIRMLAENLSDLNHAFTITLYPDPKHPPFGDRHCDYFHDRLVIDHDGNVLPCCLLPRELKHTLGNVTEGLATACSARRIERDAVFSWLSQGHAALRKKLKYQKISHNLCSTCIDMLYQISGPE